MPRLAALAAVLVLGACATTAPVSPRDALVGRWDMARIFDGGQDVSIVQNPGRDRYIALRADGSFESGGGPYARNTGRWAYDARARTLALDSDLGADNDSAWTVSVDGDRMEWRSTGPEPGRIRIVALRAR